MPLIIVAGITGFLSYICGKTGRSGLAKFFFLVAFLALVAWLASGPGPWLLNFFQHPSVPVPDNIPLPGGK